MVRNGCAEFEANSKDVYGFETETSYWSLLGTSSQTHEATCSGAIGRTRLSN
jgi:hypothetical protein